MDDEECVECRYLPFCMGNCPKIEFDKYSFTANFYNDTKDGCIYWKENLEDIVKLYVKSKEEEFHKSKI